MCIHLNIPSLQGPYRLQQSNYFGSNFQEAHCSKRYDIQSGRMKNISSYSQHECCESTGGHPDMPEMCQVTSDRERSFIAML